MPPKLTQADATPLKTILLRKRPILQDRLQSPPYTSDMLLIARSTDGFRKPAGRYVGAASRRDFPGPFVRFWLCLEVESVACR
ncbi:MAG TPA: hypothetical protein VH540_21365 [Ktedonobacterales bacterium]